MQQGTCIADDASTPAWPLSVAAPKRYPPAGTARLRPNDGVAQTLQEPGKSVHSCYETTHLAPGHRVPLLRYQVDLCVLIAYCFPSVVLFSTGPLFCQDVQKRDQ